MYVETKEEVPRDLHIILKDVLKHQPTTGCPGCSGLQRGRGIQPHHDKCRERFKVLMAKDKKVINAEVRWK